MGLIFKKFSVCLETNKDHFDIKNSITDVKNKLGGSGG